jgi:DNA-binding CsgD family transcriptional regulator
LTNNKLNIADFVQIFNYRAKVKGEYLVVVSQASVIESDSKGNPLFTMLIVSISPNQNFSGSVQYKLMNVITGEEITPMQEKPVERIHILSSREVEILRLIEKGYTSSDISQRLNIRLNTVNTHRQHILKKLKAKTSFEAIKSAMAKGII